MRQETPEKADEICVVSVVGVNRSMHTSNSILLLAAFCSGICYAGLGVSYKAASAQQCRTLPFTIVLAFTAGTLALVFSFREQSLWADPRLWALGGFCAITFSSAILFLIRANAYGPASVNWVVMNLSLLIPILVSACCLGEPLYWIDLLALALFGLMIWAFSHGTADIGVVSSRRWKFFLMLMFMANGCMLTAYKYQNHLYHGQNASGFVVMMFYSVAALALASYWVRYRQVPFRRPEWNIRLLAGASNGLGTLCFSWAMSGPAISVFPISQGVSMLGGALSAMVIYHERCNCYKVIGIMLSVLVLGMMIYRERIMMLLRL